MQTLLADSLLSVDFIGFIERNGENRFHELLDDISKVKSFVSVRQNADHDKTKIAMHFAINHACNVATMYRKEALLIQSDLKKLLSKPDHIYHPRDHREKLIRMNIPDHGLMVPDPITKSNANRTRG